MKTPRKPLGWEELIGDWELITSHLSSMDYAHEKICTQERLEDAAKEVSYEMKRNGWHPGYKRISFGEIGMAGIHKRDGSIEINKNLRRRENNWPYYIVSHEVSHSAGISDESEAEIVSYLTCASLANAGDTKFESALLTNLKIKLEWSMEYKSREEGVPESLSRTVADILNGEVDSRPLSGKSSRDLYRYAIVPYSTLRDAVSSGRETVTIVSAGIEKQVNVNEFRKFWHSHQ